MHKRPIRYVEYGSFGAYMIGFQKSTKILGQKKIAAVTPSGEVHSVMLGMFEINHPVVLWILL